MRAALCKAEMEIVKPTLAANSKIMFSASDIPRQVHFQVVD